MTILHSKINSVQAFPSYFCKVLFNIASPSMPRSFKRSTSFRFPSKTLHAFSSFPCVLQFKPIPALVLDHLHNF